MHVLSRDRLALAIALVATALSLVVLLFGRYQPGIHLFVVEDRIEIIGIDTLSQAEADGLRPGMVVVDLNGQPLWRFPEPIYGEYDPDQPDIEPPLLGYVPPEPTPVGLSGEVLQGLTDDPIQFLAAIEPAALTSFGPDQGWPMHQVFYPGYWDIAGSSLALIPGLAILLVGTWWVAVGRAGESLRGLALPLAVASAVPFLVQPLHALGSPLLAVVAWLLVALAVLPLAFGLTAKVADPEERRMVRVGVGVLAAAAAGVSVLSVVTPGGRNDPELVRWLLTGGIALVPGLVAAGPIDLAGFRATGRTPGSLLQSAELAVAGATPLFAIGTDEYPYVFPLALWLGAILLAGRFTVRPLARLVTRAQLQRDLVVAATEAERARLAADIHDDALQELTLLVRRLEAAGDDEGAEIGRTVADRLRAICGDLRLPILDDLGVGPALDWLVLRIERLAGGEVRLERSDDARHNPDVELAIFRVAQEALANAVKHGSPPIVVRYRSTESGISLTIDDSGPGIAADAGDAAERAGHFGLLNMQQRAEAIGAILDIRRWPAGGTHVALEWRPR